MIGRVKGLHTQKRMRVAMHEIRIFTIGFTHKTAEQFFTVIMDAGVRRILDVRLNNSSQLAGFARCQDLPYFLKTICGIDYVHRPDLAPTKEILEAFKKQKGEWAVYERDFRHLIFQRAIHKLMADELRDGDCLLCSEPTPEHCHRRLVAEHLKAKLGQIEICHL
jgi:uncharacterized protein (DUF488 family)